ncbi:MAG: hypothetical protein WCO63_05800 [Bacteroidota bacterium]
MSFFASENTNWKLSGLLVLLLQLILLIQTSAYAQKNPANNAHQVSIVLAKGQILKLRDTVFIPYKDTIIILSDSVKFKIEKDPETRSEAFYDSLKVRAYKTRITKELYKLVITNKKNGKTEQGLTIQATSVYEPFKGRPIGSIRLKKVNVLEGEVDDTNKIAGNPMAKLANQAHIQTRDKIIYNALIFKRGDPLSPDDMADNERIIRSLGFIHDARIHAIPRKEDPDTVDILIITQDKFEYQFTVNFISPTNFNIKGSNNSIFGMGKQIGFEYKLNSSHDPASGYLLYYKDRNFNRSFVDIEVLYSHYWAKEGTEINIKKDFLTPQTKYGGGLNAGNTSEQMGIGDYPDTSFVINYTHNFQDVWLGRSFQLGSRSKRENLTFAARIHRDEFTTRPITTVDTNMYFINNLLVLGGITFTHVSYLRSSMIRSFGLTEDMPVGYYMEADGGMFYGEFTKNPYIGFKGGWGKYDPNLGYFFGVIKVGMFLNSTNYKQGATDLNCGYFTPLLELRRWRFRQFVTFHYTGGLNRSMNKTISMNDMVNGLKGTEGNQRAVWHLESVFFKPLSFYGFQMALFAYADMGIIGNGETPEALRSFYSSYGGGIRLRNDGLIIQTMEIKLGYVPKLPDASGRFVYEFSGNDPLLFKELSITRPEIVPFE